MNAELGAAATVTVVVPVCVAQLVAKTVSSTRIPKVPGVAPVFTDMEAVLFIPPLNVAPVPLATKLHK